MSNIESDSLMKQRHIFMLLGFLYAFFKILNNLINLKKSRIAFFLLLMIIFINSSNAVYAAEEVADPPAESGEGGGVAAAFGAENGALDTILDTLTSLTCETQGIGNLLRSEFSHTCIPAPFFTFVAANIISPGLYANTFLRLYINDDELFPESCSRSNRIDYYDQKISFSLCNNTKLAISRASAITDAAIVIAKSIFTGGDPWEEIMEAWNVPKEDYHTIYTDIKEGEEDTLFDIGIIPVLPWKVIVEKDKMCVATQSFSGWIPIGCKYIKEPYPTSIYADFMGGEPEGDEGIQNQSLLTSCSNMGGCYKRAFDNSRASIIMTGPLIECVREMIAKLMISSEVCSFDDIKTVLGDSGKRTTSSLYVFQRNMHKAVTALLTIYIILFGFRIILSGNVPEKVDVVNFVIKFLFVTYFAIGININAGSGDDSGRLDGMIEWAFPFLLDGMTQIGSWVVNASPSQLCKFDDVYYPDGLKHLQLWDSLDCRISHYLGLDAIQTLLVENAMNNHDFTRLDNLSFPIPPYVYLLIPAAISGSFTLISLVLMYPLLIISIGAFIVNATVVCMISIVILGILAPIFVPMYLFNYTKGYFESWVKLLLSFMLQPMVAIVFMTSMLAVFDFGFYGTCKYVKKDFNYSGENFLIGDTVLDNAASVVNGSRSVRYFYVDQDWENNYTIEEAEGCQDSLGFILNNPFQFIFNTGEEALTGDSIPWLNDASGEEEKKRFDFLGSIQPSPGMFFDMLEVSFNKIKKLIITLLTACLILYLMYHFSASLSEFAADMTEGVSLSGVAISPHAIYKASMGAVSTATGGDAKGKIRGGLKKVQNKLPGGKLFDQAKDMVSGKSDGDSGAEGAADAISAGGDAAGAAAEGGMEAGSEAAGVGASAVGSGASAGAGAASTAAGGAGGAAAGGAGGAAVAGGGAAAAGAAGAGAAGAAGAGTVGGIAGTVAPVVGNIAGASVAGAAGGAVAGAAGGAVAGAGGAAAGGAVGSAGGSAAGATTAGAVGTVAAEGLKEVAIQVGKEVAKEVAKEVVKQGVDIAKDVAKDIVKEVAKEAVGTVKDAAVGAVETVKDTAEDAINEAEGSSVKASKKNK